MKSVSHLLLYVFFLVFSTALAEEHESTSKNNEGFGSFFASSSFRSTVANVPVGKFVCIDGQYYHDHEGTTGAVGPCLRLPVWKGWKVSTGVSYMFGKHELRTPAVTSRWEKEWHLSRNLKAGIEGRLVYGFKSSFREEHESHHNAFFESSPCLSYKGWGTCGVGERYHHREVEWKGGFGLFREIKHFPTPQVEFLWPHFEVRLGLQHKFALPWQRH